MTIDLICGMEMDERTAIPTSKYKGQTSYFCAPRCQRSFDKDPEKYLAQAGKPLAATEPSDSPQH